MNIYLNDDEALKRLISEAIFQTLDSGKRETLIKEAIAYLLRPAGDRAGNESPIESAFRRACIAVTEKIAEETVVKDEAFKAKVKALLVEAVERFNGPAREKLIERLAEAIGRAVIGRDY